MREYFHLLIGAVIVGLLFAYANALSGPIVGAAFGGGAALCGGSFALASRIGSGAGAMFFGLLGVLLFLTTLFGAAGLGLWHLMT